MKFLPSIPVKKIFGKIFLYLFGLLIGLFLFMPWEIVWSKGVDFANKKISKVNINYSEFLDAGPLSFAMSNVVIKLPKGQKITLPELDVNFGLSPLLEVKVKTGPTLTAKIFRTKTLTVRGGMDLKKVINFIKLDGKIRIVSDVNFAKLGGVPKSASLLISSPQLEVPGGLITKDIKLNAELRGNQFKLSSFKCGKPIPVIASGNAKVDWRRLSNTTYNIKGKATFGTTERSFVKKGKLSKYVKF